MNVKYIFFGSSEFSRIILERLIINNIFPELVITQPDRPKKRGLKILPTELAIFAEKNNLSILKPNSLKKEDFLKKIKELDVDFFIVVDYGKILSKELLSIPKRMSIGIHPSLLPKYRGPAPINWVLINGEKETGTTVFRMNEFLDSGDIILQKKIDIKDTDDFFSLYNILALESADLLIESLKLITKGKASFIKQDEKEATFMPKLKKEDGRINWNKTALEIFNLVRGVVNWPTAFTYYKNKFIKILKVELTDLVSEDIPSTIVKIDKSGIYVATSDKLLKILKLKPEGKKDMDAYSFTLGHNINIKDRFE